MTKKEHNKAGQNQPKQVSANSPVSWAVFLFTLTIVLISLVSVAFPSLIASGTTSQIPKAGVPDPYEPGILAGPLIAIDIIVIAVAILYFKNRLPHIATNKLGLLFSFETSRRTTIITMLVFLAIYIGLSAPELATEEKWLDFKGVEKRLQGWDLGDVTRSFEPHITYLFDTISMQVFGNYKVIPFISSILLVILTFFITRQLTQKNFAGLVAVAILLQSYVFLSYDTSVTYPSYWISLYLVSLYLINKKWSALSVGPYILSIFSKALTALFLPMSLFFTYRANTSKKTKIITVIVYAVIGMAGLGAFATSAEKIAGSDVSLSAASFWQGFVSMAFQLRFDSLVVVFLLPLIVGLFMASRNGIKQADSIMVLIAGMLFSAPLLTGFTDQTNQPYRFLPLVVFFAMGVGILLTKNTHKETISEK